MLLGFEESIDRSKIMCACVRGNVRDELKCEEGSVFSKNVKKARFSRFRVCVVVQALRFMSASVLLPYITSLLRKTNRVGEDSCCRGGIVHIPFGFYCALLVTASSSHGALAVSCKYFKQSKWPNSAARSHANSLYLSNLRSTRYSSM